MWGRDGFCKYAIVALATALVTFLVAARAEATRFVRATRGTPTIDGSLDEAVWQHAAWTDPFTQRTPATGAPGSHRTRAAVLYDTEFVYIAIDCETSSRPLARRGRRDSLPNGEWARVMIDSRGEGVTASAFTTNPAGIQNDAIAQGDGDIDTAWDAIWSVETTVTDHGWRAEFAIPWRALRFSAADPALRIQFERNDYAAGETTALIPIPPDSTRYVANFATLGGLRGVSPRRLLEFRGYWVARWRALRNPDLGESTPTLSQTTGLDVRFGITNDLVLDGTLNPDFGQVELDPAVVNLTTFQTFFNERRPFFLEGTDLFSTPIRLVHTRRIGAQPPFPDPMYGGTVLSTDAVAPIWGALKLAGRIGPISVNVLDSLTGPAHAIETGLYPSSSTRPGNPYPTNRQAIIDAAPMTNWLAARLRAPLGSGSNVGGLFTHVARFDRDSHPDFVGAFDWNLRGPDGVHRLRGQLAGSQAWNSVVGDHSGGALFLELARAEDPFIIWALRCRAYSRRFDPNGLGYLDRNNMIAVNLDVTVRTPHPVGLFRQLYVNPFAWRYVNTANLVIDQGAGVEFGMTGRSNWSAGFGGRVSSELYDDRETRGGIPWYNPPSGEGWAFFSTDPRVRVRADGFANLMTQQSGRRGSVQLNLAWNVAPFLAVSLATTGRIVVNIPRWVDTVSDGSGSHYIFGVQRSQIIDMTFRATAAITRRVTFDLYSQLLLASIRYESFGELVTPEQLVPTAYGGHPNQDILALTVNAVLRIEMLPGSFFTIVLLHRSDLTAGEYDAGYNANFGMLGIARPDTSLMGKITLLL